MKNSSRNAQGHCSADLWPLLVSLFCFQHVYLSFGALQDYFKQRGANQTLRLLYIVEPTEVSSRTSGTTALACSTGQFKHRSCSKLSWVASRASLAQCFVSCWLLFLWYALAPALSWSPWALSCSRLSQLWPQTWLSLRMHVR